MDPTDDEPAAAHAETERLLDDLALANAETERLLELALAGDLEACRVLAEGLRDIGLPDLAAALEVASDPALARRVAFLIDEERYPDD